MHAKTWRHALLSGLLFINRLQISCDSLLFLTLAQWVVYTNYM